MDAIVVYNGDPQTLTFVQDILHVHGLKFNKVMLIATPFTSSNWKGEYDEEIVELTIAAIKIALSRYQISGRRVFLICGNLWDEEPAGEIAGALAGHGDLLFYYSDGRLALPDSSSEMTHEEAKRVFSQVWGFDTRLTHLLSRRNITPRQLLIMPEPSLWAVAGLGKTSIDQILAAREQILAKQPKPFDAKEARRQYREVWQLETYPATMLIRSGISPEELLDMDRDEILAIRGIGPDALEKILAARERILNS